MCVLVLADKGDGVSCGKKPREDVLRFRVDVPIEYRN